MLRVVRKRFIERIKSPHRVDLIAELLKHESGRDFQSALTHWASRASVPSEVLALEKAARSRRCSVIINTVDRAEDLALTLAALKREWSADDELIIVLGPTGDHSEAIIRQSPVPCRLLHCGDRNLAISRNLGLQAAAGEWIAFIDDDASPADGWLDALLRPFEEDVGVGISAGFVLDGHGRNFLNRHVVADTLGRAYWLKDAAEAHEKIEQLGAHRSFVTATGCNMAFRRATLEAIGAFDPFYGYFLEETDAVRRAITAGFRCAVSPASKVLHRLGSNLARTTGLEIAPRTVVVRSQIHFIGKFGKATFSAADIEDCVWERVLLDLEKMAWDCSGHAVQNPGCGSLQQAYLSAVADELRLDSTSDSSSLLVPPLPS